MNVLKDETVSARRGGAWIVKKGQHIRFIDVEGGQIGDLVLFNANDLSERFNQSRTRSNPGKYLISTGDHLYSKFNNIMLTIVEDTSTHAVTLLQTQRVDEILAASTDVLESA